MLTLKNPPKSLQVFRLVSKSLPPRVIHLIPKLFRKFPLGRWVVIVVFEAVHSGDYFSAQERPCEDTEQELKERIYRSALSAVDLDQIKHAFLVVRVPWIESLISTHIPCFPDE